GVLLPIAIYAAINWGQPGVRGWGIPMATDIAFCVGVLALQRRRVSHALVVFITALAIFDDIAGILVIAVYFGHGLRAGWLLAAAGVTALLFFASRRGVSSGWAWFAGGLLLWIALHASGIHPTIAGVILGLSVPARPPPGAPESPLDRFERKLHPWVAYGVM